MDHYPSPAYDTALTAAVWQRVSPALPAFGDAPPPSATPAPVSSAAPAAGGSVTPATVSPTGSAAPGRGDEDTATPGSCCPLPRRGSSPARLERLVETAAALCAAGRRCWETSPARYRGTVGCLVQAQRQTLRAVLAAHYAHTGQWYQPPLLTLEAQPWPGAVRRVYLLEASLARWCREAAASAEELCLWRLLEAQAEGAAARGERLLILLENALTTGNSLLK